jgi:hypothetical protein
MFAALARLIGHRPQPLLPVALLMYASSAPPGLHTGASLPLAAGRRGSREEAR